MRKKFLSTVAKTLGAECLKKASPIPNNHNPEAVGSSLFAASEGSAEEGCAFIVETSDEIKRLRLQRLMNGALLLDAHSFSTIISQMKSGLIKDEDIKSVVPTSEKWLSVLHDRVRANKLTDQFFDFALTYGLDVNQECGKFPSLIDLCLSEPLERISDYVFCELLRLTTDITNPQALITYVVNRSEFMPDYRIIELAAAKIGPEHLVHLGKEDLDKYLDLCRADIGILRSKKTRSKKYRMICDVVSPEFWREIKEVNGDFQIKRKVKFQTLAGDSLQGDLLLSTRGGWLKKKCLTFSVSWDETQMALENSLKVKELDLGQFKYHSEGVVTMVFNDGAQGAAPKYLKSFINGKRVDIKSPLINDLISLFNRPAPDDPKGGAAALSPTTELRSQSTPTLLFECHV